MQCKCCNAEYQAGEAICPVCGFPTLVEAMDEGTVKMIDEHRAKFVRGISVWLQIYCYSSDDMGVFGEPECRGIKLADMSELTVGKIKWSEAEFIDLVSDRRIQIEISFKRDGSERSAVLSVKPAKPIKYGRIGITAEAGMKIRLAVGEYDKYVYSDAVSVV